MPQPAVRLSPSGRRPAVELFEAFDRFAQGRNQLRRIAGAAAEWAGIPMPIEGERLVIEPSYPFAEILSPRLKSPPSEDGGLRIRQVFWCRRRQTEVVIYETQEGRVRKLFVRNENVDRLDKQIRTLGCSFAWGIEQEGAAVHLLGTLVRHHTFKTYMLTGQFLETSARSGVTYLFRRLRPTIAMKPDQKNDGMKILAALCMHPIGYYAGSWAGAMCPTDDVIAHLQLMRGDEKLYWRRCQQHAPWAPEAGL